MFYTPPTLLDILPRIERKVALARERVDKVKDLLGDAESRVSELTGELWDARNAAGVCANDGCGRRLPERHARVCQQCADSGTNWMCF